MILTIEAIAAEEPARRTWATTVSLQVTQQANLIVKTSAENTPEEATLKEVTSINSEPNVADPSHDDEKAWTRINDQRVALIHKQIEHGLTVPERQILDRLEAAMIRHNDVIAPLPWKLLDELDSTIRQITAATK